MKIIQAISIGCIAITVLVLFSCIPKPAVKQEKFVLPKASKGYYAIFYGDNYNPIEDTTDVREYRFDSTRIVLTKFRLNTNAHNELFLRKNNTVFDTLRSLLYPGQLVDANSIYTSRVETRRQVNKNKEVIAYVFYVGIPSSDPGREEFFFSRKLDSTADINFFGK